MPKSSAAGEGAGDQRRAESIHDFSAKLRQSGALPQVMDYVKWQRQVRAARTAGEPEPATPQLVPVSINLDLTTACNYACDHCIDWDILNSKVRYADEDLRASIRNMVAGGLRSAILIGGGEPTLYPGFVSFVEFLKELGLQVAVVSNGSRNDRILQIAPFLGAEDWVRLSLDSGSNSTFQRMHNPSRKTLTLDEICAWVPKIKAANPDFDMGFSFVITWRGGSRGDVKIVENIHEIASAAERARNAGFNYISYKPFLERTDAGSEIMDPAKTEAELQDVVRRIQSLVDEARKLERPGFRVMESTNLRVLIRGNWEDYTRQPRMCHMQSLRQVVTPLGLYNCPAHRGVAKARIGEKDAYKDSDSMSATAEATKGILDGFDASRECDKVTCLYNGTNWWIEGLIESGEMPEALPDKQDYFL
jgi:sulfatase maturation enzyme AslB (radical SAM superfamily)